MRRVVCYLAVFMLVLGLTGLAYAQIPSKCAYDSYPTPCQSVVGDDLCPGGCSASLAISHQGAGGPNGGAWDFAGTEFGACGHTTPCSPVAFPILRFWEFDHYMTANSGCQNNAIDPSNSNTWWVVNLMSDFSVGTDPGYWVGYQANWNGVEIDGCRAGNVLVTEFSFPDSPTETSANHKGYFMIMSTSSLNLDTVSGGMGTNGNVIPVIEIPKPDSPVPAGSENTTDTSYTDYNITMPAAGDMWYTENGANDVGRPLIDGVGLMYINDTTPPTSSSPSAYTGWGSLPSAPDDTTPLVLPFGATTAVTFKTPAAGEATYVAAVIHYADASVTGATDFLGSWATSGHIVLPGGQDVEWGSYSAKVTPDGVVIEWTTLMEIDTLGFYVEKSLESVQDFNPVPGGMVSARFPGYTYTYLDTDFTPGQTPYYRVVELTPEGENDRTPVFTLTVDTEGRGLHRSRGSR